MLNHQVEDFLSSLKIEYKNKKNINDKFNLLNLIVQIEVEDDKYNSSLYEHLKIWLKLYIKSIENNKMEYDKIVFSKVKEKIELLNIEQQYEILKYFIRFLKKELHETAEYELYKKRLEIKILFKKYKFTSLLIKGSSYNFWTVTLAFFVFTFVSAITWKILQTESLGLMKINLNMYSSSEYWNYFFNILGYVFSLGSALSVNSSVEFIFLLLVKLLFFVLITYFVLREVSKKMEKYL